MTVEVNPVGIRCGAKNGGLDCAYCYERCARMAAEAGPLPTVDLDAIKTQVSAARGDHFSLHGGEALLARTEDLERLWAWGLEKYGRNGIQTSGRPITEEHLRLFRKYKVHVGFSIDGPGELNDARCAGTAAETRAATAHSERMLRRCLREEHGASLIVTLHKVNASPARLPRLVAWFRSLARAGLRSARLHVLQAGPRDAGHALVLPVHEAIAAMRAARALQCDLARPRWIPWLRCPLQFDVFVDMRKLLTARDDQVTCLWNACDPWSTTSVIGVNPDGTRHGCGRSAEDSRWIPMAGGSPLVRSIALSETPQAEGGCQGCRFFVACKGNCPGQTEGGDWRSRSSDCELWRTLLEDEEAALEAEGWTPVTRRTDLAEIEERMKAGWAVGQRPSIRSAVDRRKSQACHDGRHLDHADSARWKR